ncbi:MgtC/SapB family protein [Candidatus Eisenbacteria bacterium]|uniref:MgtC/SapB family protein n=1 Tax=Eiseniibacteriota bacterium TaxID=2212470 RepID=A0ABV6YLW6_UNCEI
MDFAGFVSLEGGALWKLLLAPVLAGMVGLEREWHGRAAGLRTHVLVCLGSTILIIAARSAGEAFAVDSLDARLVLDPNRIAAGIVTGIGFLGAGAILRTGDLIRGLTTAACVWFVAALGIVIGNGLYVLAVVSTLLVLLVLIVFDVVEQKIPSLSYRSLSVRVALSDGEAFQAWCSSRLVSTGVRIQDVLRQVDNAEGFIELIFRIRARGIVPGKDLTKEISEQPGVQQVRWEQD